MPGSARTISAVWLQKLRGFAVNCQKCNSTRVGEIRMFRPLCSFTVEGHANSDSDFPSDIGLGTGEFAYCMDCGQIQGAWPLDQTFIEKPKSERERLTAFPFNDVVPVWGTALSTCLAQTEEWQNLRVRTDDGREVSALCGLASGIAEGDRVVVGSLMGPSELIARIPARKDGAPSRDFSARAVEAIPPGGSGLFKAGGEPIRAVNMAVEPTVEGNTYHIWEWADRPGVYFAYIAKKKGRHRVRRPARGS